MQESLVQGAEIAGDAGGVIKKTAQNAETALDDAGEAMKATRERIISIEQTQKNVETALAKVQSVMGSSADFEKKWKAFQKKFDEVLSKSLEGMRVSMQQATVDPYKGELALSEAEKTAILGGMATVEAFAKALFAKKKVVVLVGAGCSTSAGIPDFRSPGLSAYALARRYSVLIKRLVVPGTGLYDNLQKYNLPTPQDLFSVDFLRENPKPFNEVAKELWPGRHAPTPAHKLICSLHKHGKLLRCYSQNIDGLERIAGIPEEALVAAHGSFDAAHCIDCAAEADIASVKSDVDSGIIPRCAICNGLVKPDIVFFGEGLPQRFVDLHKQDMEQADAVIVIGTSLQVQPFSNLPNMVSDHVPRLLINREAVGPFVCPCAFPGAAESLKSQAGLSADPTNMNLNPSAIGNVGPHRDPLFPTGASRPRLPAIAEGPAGSETPGPGENRDRKSERSLPGGGRCTTPPGKSRLAGGLARVRSERVGSSAGTGSGSARDTTQRAVPVKRSQSTRGLREDKDEDKNKASEAAAGAGAGARGAGRLRRAGSMPGRTMAGPPAGARERKAGASGAGGGWARLNGRRVGSAEWEKEVGGGATQRGGKEAGRDSAQSQAASGSSRRELKLPTAGGREGGVKKPEAGRKEGERSKCESCGRWVYRDVLLLGDCDQGAQRLAKALGYV